MNDHDIERLEALLIDRVTGDLEAEDIPELDELLTRFPGFDPESYERAAAEATVALLEDDVDALPDALATRVAASLSTGSETAGVTPLPARQPVRPLAWAGWAAAAAAVVGWVFVPGAFGPDVSADDPATVRRELVSAAQAIRLDWTATEDPAAAGATGDVVWSTVAQSGVMRFAGLEPNDPTVSQYQLWIFDATRDERFPVDGGVFDVPDGGGDVLVPIRARIDVRQPTLFAVTVERPGGVVVSDRERIVLVASLE